MMEAIGRTLGAVVGEILAPSSDERVTPPWLFDELHAEFRFGLDAAATAANAKVPRPFLEATLCYLGPDHVNPAYRDGLTASWHDVLLEVYGSLRTVWWNPPYSRGSIWRWCQKAEAELAAGVPSVGLLPADTSMRYFHEFVLQHEHRFLRRRLTFAGAPRDRHGKLAPAKFGSVLVVLRPGSPLWSSR